MLNILINSILTILTFLIFFTVCEVNLAIDKIIL